MTLQTIHFNVNLTAHQSTPGAPIYTGERDENYNKVTRPLTEAEAAKVRPDFEKYAAELEGRDPEGFRRWREAYNQWRSGDMSGLLPSSEAFATKRRIRCTAHKGPHIERPECKDVHDIASAGSEPSVGHPY
ncbi:hypothetical protein [Saccharothrix sp. ST-888]|uniref:hypothetical protein n=1 Tax=Saccharothrix sp. ST-888 TaxID=1427391 RepID=UPI0012E0AC6F|nr:hypothetical protein [Saccharothrix sp. ST-888]